MMLDPATDAQTLRKAMKGWGCDKQTVYNTVCRRSNEQLQHVRYSYRTQFNKDLIKELRSELGGDLESLVAGLVYTQPEYDAYQLHKAMKGLGTDEDVLIEILSHRTNEEVAAINAAYVQMFGATLEKDLKGDLSGDMERLFVNLAKGARHDRPNVAADVDALYRAGEGKLGTNEKVFIEIMGTSSERYLQHLSAAYAQAHGNNLVKAVDREFSGDVRKTLLAMLTPHDEYYATMIYNCCKGMGTDERRLIRTLVARRSQLPGISATFIRLYNKTVCSRVEEEFSGDMRTAMVALLSGF